MTNLSELFDKPAQPEKQEKPSLSSLFQPEASRPSPALRLMPEADPDRAAEAVKLSRRYRLPPAVAAEFVEDYRERARADDADKVLADSPKLRSWFEADATHAQIAADDVENMGAMEAAWNSLRRGVRGLKQIVPGAAFRGNASMLGNFDEVEAKIAGGAPILDAEDPMALRFMTPEQRQKLRQQLTQGAGTAATKVAGLEAEKAAIPSPPVVGRVSEAETFGGAVQEFLTDPVKYLASIGPESMVQSAPGLVAGGVAGFAGKAALGAAAMGANSFVVDYNASLLEALGKSGVDVKDPESLAAAAQNPALMQKVAAQAFAHAAVVGTVDAASGGLAAKTLVPGTSLPRRIGNLAAQTPLQGAMGGAGELGGQIASGQEIKPGEILAEIVGEAFTAPAEVGAMAAGQIRTQVAQARAAQEASATVEQLTKLAEASKVRGRDGETFKAFVEQLADEGDVPTELYIDAEKLTNTLNQSGVTMEELESVAPTVAKQLEAAINSGGAVRVPVSEFLMVREDITAMLLDDIRADESAMSRAEAEEFLKNQGDTIRADVETAMQARTDSDAFRESIAGVQSTFEAELASANRFKPDVNKAYASLLANFYGSQAARLGMAPQELLDRYKLRVQAKEATGERTLNQSSPEQAALTAISQDDEMFSLPKSTKTEVADIAAENDPDIQVQKVTSIPGEVRYNLTMPDGKTARMMVREPNPYGPNTYGFDYVDGEMGSVLNERPGENAEAVEGKGDVWVDVSLLEGGGAGAKIYNVAAAYAHNTGRIFIGDPAGLSNEALIRRPEQMLSSALKFGTTAHLAPHPRQVTGDAKLGVPPLKWVYGDDIGNIRRLIEVNLAVQDNGGLQDAISFDTESGQFRDSAGVDIDRAGIDAVAMETRIGEGSRAGGKTLARSAVLRALLRETSREGEAGGGRNGLLEKLASLGSNAPEAAEGLFYQGEGGVTPRAQIAFPADLAGSPSVISLLAGADLSSFLHESGHFFLEVQSDLAVRVQQQIADGSSVTALERGIVDDMNKLLEWFGVKGSPELSPLETWAMMSLDEKREGHETFARGFEAYAMEGKAPSIELQVIFSRFRSWLVQVYKTLRGLNVDLNDDVRGVMDRMLATDMAIEEAEAARNMGPLFKDATSAGMTLDEFGDYQATAQAATDKAASDLQTRSLKDMKWLSRAKDKALKARQLEVDDLRREIRNEVRSEVMADPVYQAWQFLTGKQDQVIPGTQAVEDVDTVVQSGRLRTQVLRDMYGTDETATWRELSARRMTSDTTGMHPEIVAEMFGFDSADALVKSLVAAMPPQEVIDARTDQRMLEMFGDITSQEAMQQAADEAVHNEARARFIASEMKALEAANKVTERRGRSSVNLLAKAAKDYAQQIIARLNVREIRPSQYAAAEARNAKLADKAFTAGKMEEAAMHKRNQLVNNYATRAAYDAQEEVRKAQAYFRKFDKRSKTIDAGYLDQIEQLLERFDFKQTTLKDIDRRKSFSAWLEEQRAEGIEPNVPAELLDEASRKSYKDMTLEEMRGLHDTVAQLEHLGRLKNKLLLARDARDFDAAAETMAMSIAWNGGKARPVGLEGPNPVMDWFAGAAAQHRKLASLFREMDGNKDQGPMYDLIGRAMNERGTMEDVMSERATVELRKLYAPMLKMKGGITGHRSKVFVPEIKASLTRGGRLAVALNWGNEANRQRLMDGDKWSEGQIRAIMRTLSQAELQFVNDMWAYLDSFWPEVAAKEKRLTGVEPEKVEAAPFNVVAADGADVAMRGGYYPLKYDAERSDRASQQEAAQTAKEMMQGAFTRATTRRGHTKARLEEVKRAVRKDLNVITQHVTQVTHDLAWHEWLIDTNKLLGDDRVSGAIREYYGPKVLKTMRDGVMGIATADVAPQTDIDKALLMLRSNVTRATMGASITTAFLQPFGLTQSMVRIGPKHVLRGLARWGGDAARMENTVSWIHGKSEFMRLRAKTFNKELREIRGSVAGKSKTMRVVDAGLFALMQKMQMVADVPTWVGQYEKSMAEGLDEASAVAMADRVVLESQGGGQTKDLAEVQRKHPMLTQFYSYFSVTLNLATEQTAATNFKNPAAVAGWLGDMALLMVIPAILPSYIMYALKGGDDDEEGLAKKLVEWQAGYLLGTVVGLREFSGAISGFDYAGPPVGRIVGDVGKAGKQTAQGEVDDRAVMAYVSLLGTAFGIPTTQALRSYKGWKAWDEGEEGAGPQSVLFGPPPRK